MGWYKRTEAKAVGPDKSVEGPKCASISNSTAVLDEEEKNALGEKGKAGGFVETRHARTARSRGTDEQEREENEKGKEEKIATPYRIQLR